MAYKTSDDFVSQYTVDDKEYWQEYSDWFTDVVSDTFSGIGKVEATWSENITPVHIETDGGGKLSFYIYHFSHHVMDKILPVILETDFRFQDALSESEIDTLSADIEDFFETATSYVDTNVDESDDLASSGKGYFQVKFGIDINPKYRGNAKYVGNIVRSGIDKIATTIDTCFREFASEIGVDSPY